MTPKQHIRYEMATGLPPAPAGAQPQPLPVVKMHEEQIDILRSLASR